MAVLISGGRKALTCWRKEETLAGKFSLLSVSPRTGRTHQIRVHLSYIGHAIVGDPVYGYRKNWWKRHPTLKNNVLMQVKRQMLHAHRLVFIHPDTGEFCEFQAPLPEDMDALIKNLRLIQP